MKKPTKKDVVKVLYFTGQAIGSLALFRLAFTPIGAAMLAIYVVTQTAHDLWTAKEVFERELSKEQDDV